MTRIFTTTPLPIIDVPADARHHANGRGGFPIQYIVIHATGGINSLKWLTTDPGSDVSAQRLITKRGLNYKLVPDEDTSYCAGKSIVGAIDPDDNDLPGVARNFNQVSLNIELENLNTGRDPYPIAQMHTCALQLVEWIGKYGFLAIVGHGWIDARKNDPLGFDWGLLHRLIYAEIRLLPETSAVL